MTLLPNQYEDGRRVLLDQDTATRMIRERDRVICEQAQELGKLHHMLLQASNTIRLEMANLGIKSDGMDALADLLWKGGNADA